MISLQQVYSISSATMAILLPLSVFSYNIDVKHSIIYSDPSRSNIKNIPVNFRDSYFGYSVLLYPQTVNTSSWLIVGAPRSNYTKPRKDLLKYPNEPGVVYRCSLSHKCSEIRPIKIENEYGYLTQVDMNIMIEKQHGWFGAAISVQKSSDLLTVCAPRTIMNVISSYTAQYLYTMHGICYSGSISSNDLFIEDKDASTYNFATRFWYNPLHGFSIHYPPIQENKEVPDRIVGEPTHKLIGTVDITSSNKRKSVELPSSDETSLFGYSVTSGCFFKKDQLLYASGAPGWQHKGQVGIIDPKLEPAAVILSVHHDGQIGQYFGASLAAGDLNNDGLDDLIVGAPHSGHDNGGIHYFLGNAAGFFEVGVVLKGIVEGAQFGYSLACGDLDDDGFADIIVGAPWEESGVIYIYNGRSVLQKSNLFRPSQRIEAYQISFDLQGFGFSISEPVDIDANGFPEIAVGAYKSGHAVILRGRPVIKSIISVDTYPSTLQRNSNSFLINLCIKYYGKNVRSIQSFDIEIRIDEDYKRIKEEELLISNVTATLDKYTCVNSTVMILHGIRNFIDPVNIYAKHRIVDYDAIEFGVAKTSEEQDTFCKYCPVESKESALETNHVTLPFDIGCGEDKVCNSNIFARATFLGVRDNNVWVIGSEDICLEVTLENYGEPAYLTLIVFSIPDGITLRSVLPSCQEDTRNTTLMVTCDVGNPLGKGIEKTIMLELDMRSINHGSAHDKVLTFNVMIKTRSVDHGIGEIKVPLHLKSEASLSISGKANEETYYYSRMNKNNLNISFQHTYQILKFGATPLLDARLTIKVPIAIGNSTPFLLVYKPQLYISGKRYECSSKDIALLEFHRNEIPEVDTLSVNEFNLKMNNNNNSGTKNKLLKRDCMTEEPTIKKIPKNTEVQRMMYDVMNVTDELPIQVNEMKEQVEVETIHLNCFTNNVRCGKVTCNLDSLKTPQDVGKILMKLILLVSKFEEGSEHDKKIIQLSTEARVDIIQPSMSMTITKPRSVVQLTTAFYGIPKTQKITFWIMLASVILGLILLSLIMGILNWLGFFKRYKKEELAALKTGDTILEVDDKEETLRRK